MTSFVSASPVPAKASRAPNADIRLLMVERDSRIGQALGGLLAEEPGLRVVAHASTTAQALDILRREPCDVALLHVSPYDPKVLEVLAALRAAAPRLAVLVVSLAQPEPFGAYLLARGAAGYLHLARWAAPREWVRAIRTVANGRAYLGAPEISLSRNGSFGGVRAARAA